MGGLLPQCGHSTAAHRAHASLRVKRAVAMNYKRHVGVEPAVSFAILLLCCHTEVRPRSNASVRDGDAPIVLIIDLW